MGTRSLTRVQNQYGQQYVNMYLQFDGYLEGHGKDLYNFLKDITVVNGYFPGDPRKLANGAGCLAAQLVAHFKTKAGGCYLEPIEVTDCGQEFEYIITVIESDWSSEGRIKVKVTGYGDNEMKEFGQLVGGDK